MTAVLQMAWLTTPAMVGPLVRNQPVGCWRDVSNAGGAVGFPFPPVSDDQVIVAVDAMVRSLGEDTNRVLIATSGGELAGWLLVAGNSNELTAHWARVLRVQTALEFRNCGVGRALMEEVARAATEDFALEQLRLELRAGMGLEGFYESCGWRESGRWPNALRLPSGDRDEVLMVLGLNRSADSVDVR